MAEALNRPNDEIILFKERANYYKNVFDSSTNFMRGRLKNGNFQKPFKLHSLESLIELADNLIYFISFLN